VLEEQELEEEGVETVLRLSMPIRRSLE
jgi:hypothetical protein